MLNIFPVNVNTKLSYGIKGLLAASIVSLAIPTLLYAQESNSLEEKAAAQDPPPVSLPIVVLEPPVVIPDNNMVTINGQKIAGPSTVNGNLTVEVVLEHTWVGDLIIKLRSPSNTEVTLLDRPGVPSGAFGCSDNDMNVIFDDTASINPETHCSGTNPWLTGLVLPAESLAAFNGESTEGNWSLIVSDNAGGDTGRVLSWNIFVRGTSLDATIGDFQVAALGNGSVQANWTTLREENHGGFNLYRVCSGNGGNAIQDVAHLYSQNPYGPLVPAGVEPQADGTRYYSYQDTPPMGVGTCHYTLENVDLAGHMSPYKEGESVAIRSVELNN
jgi:subtilisin-like proprotein convertase family protein